MIKVTYSSIDGARRSRTFKAIEPARKWAQDWVGTHPEMGSYYAVSGDGIGKVTVVGAKLTDLFPAPA